MRTNRPTPAQLLLLGILLLAAGLRLTHLDRTEFKADEAGIARHALALVHDGEWVAVGPSSSQGPAHPPLQIYLMALPFGITPDPRLAVALIALIHTAAVGMAFVLGARFFDRRVGLIAAFLFAVNPWAITYSRKIWTQNWPLATTLFIFCLLLLVVEKRRWALMGAGLALIPLVGTHLGGLAFVLVLALVLLSFPSRVERRPLLLGLCVFLLFASPYLFYDATHGWANLRGFLDLGSADAQFDLDAARFAAWLSSGFHYEDLAGARKLQFLSTLPNLRWLDIAEMLLFGAALLYLVSRVLRHALQGRDRWQAVAGRDVVLLLWLLVPVALQTRHSQPVYPHYFILLYPVQHLVIALLLSDGWRWSRSRLGTRWGRWAAAGTVVLIVAIGAIGAWQVALGQSFVRFVARYDTPGGYGPILGPLRQAAAVAGEAAQAAGAEAIVISAGDDPIWDNLPAAFDVLLPRQLPRRFVDGRTALLFPLQPATYIIAPEMDHAVASFDGQVGAQPVATIDAPGDRPLQVFQRTNVNRDDVLTAMTALRSTPRLGNGVAFLAYQVGPLRPTVSSDDAPGAVLLPFTLAWWLDGEPPPDTDYHIFAHLLAHDGERWGQHDLSSFPTHAWRAGDLVLTDFKIPVKADPPPGEYTIRVGMYTYPDLQNVAVLDPAGNPAADAVSVGPISLP